MCKGEIASAELNRGAKGTQGAKGTARLKQPSLGNSRGDSPPNGNHGQALMRCIFGSYMGLSEQLQG
jgi:hypothetical protein